MTRAKQIGVGLAVALLAVVTVGTISVSSTRTFLRANENVRATDATLMTVRQMLLRLSDAESSVRGYIVTGDTSYLAAYTRAHVDVRAITDSLAKLTRSDSAQHARVAVIAALAQRKLDRLDEAYAIRHDNGLAASIALADAGKGRAVMDTLHHVTGAVLASAGATLRQELEVATHAAKTANFLAAVGAVVRFVLLSLAAFLMIREFSVRRGAETALRENQAQLTQFLDSLPIGAVVVDATGRASFANTTALSMFGAASLGELAEHTRDTLMPLWREADHAPLTSEDDPMRAALRGLAAQGEGLEIHIGETRIPIEISAAPVFDSTGNVAFAISTFSDITERQRARAAMEMARRAAEDASQAKSDFLARMSHELRTPLNSVIGFANILLKNKAGNLREQDETYLQRILDNGKHLLLLINDILDLSKIESGKVQVEWESVDLGAILMQTVQQLEPQTKAGVQLAAEVPSSLEPITSDASRLRQIAINLLGNALKFTQTGSVRIVVDAEPGTKRPARIRVIDTGIGIPPERLNAIFDSFEQADHTTSRQFGGTGLGLPISRALCELLGYTLTVKSELGAGTEFSVDLLATEKRRTTQTLGV